MKRKSGFTLVELLVVLVIIGILSGMVFKLYAVATRHALKAKTVGVLEKVAFALEEYRAEYGMYPPVDFIEYAVGPVGDGTTDAFAKRYLHTPSAWGGTTSNELYKFGLVSYLWPRSEILTPEYIEQGSGWIPDTERDYAAKKRWQKYIQGVAVQVGTTSTNLCPNTCVSNSVATIWDAWEHTINYSSKPPYTSYELWSSGPDGSPGTSDDLHKNKWDN